MHGLIFEIKNDSQFVVSIHNKVTSISSMMVGKGRSHQHARRLLYCKNNTCPHMHLAKAIAKELAEAYNYEMELSDMMG
jgi:hypothetical protein